LLGFPAPDFSGEDDSALLHQKLPLRGERDRHVLLLNIAEGWTLRDLLGDDGRLEFWMRASDISRSQFDEAVTFLRSA
jgi:hypothetical protein